MPMSGASLSGAVQANMVSNPPSAPATAHTKAWDNVGNAIIAELLAAAHSPSPATCNSGGTLAVPVDPASITAAGMKSAVMGAIAGVSGVTPANAHVKYWDAISTAGIIGYLTTNLKLRIPVSTTTPVAHTYAPSFGAKTGLDLGIDIRAAIGLVTGVTPANAHDKYWTAVTGAIITFITSYYVSVPSPGVGGIGTTLTVSVS